MSDTEKGTSRRCIKCECENNGFSLAYAKFELLLDNQIEMSARVGYNNNDCCVLIRGQIIFY